MAAYIQGSFSWSCLVRLQPCFSCLRSPRSPSFLASCPIQPGSRSVRCTAPSREETGANADARPVNTGQTFTILDVDGPGMISHVWFTLDAPEQYALKDRATHVLGRQDQS